MPSSPTVAHRAGRQLLAASVVVLLVAACGPSAAEEAADAAVAARVAAVREAREVVGPAAVALVEASEGARLAALAVLGDRPDDPTTWGEVAAAVVDGSVADLQTVAAEVAEVGDRLADPDEADVAAALAAVAEANDAAAAQVTALTDELEGPSRHAALWAELDEIAAGWETPASRSVQIALLGDLGDRADALAASLPTVDAAAPCTALRDLDALVLANAAATSRELRDLVQGYRGLAFDARRAELRDAPFGVTPDEFAAAAADDADCLAAGPLAAPPAIAVLVDDVRIALSPDDLTG